MSAAGLYAPESYWSATDRERAATCNGCGVKGIGPDTLWGLNVRMACDIHDWMYSIGKTHLDKEAADRAFLNNLLRLIDADSACDDDGSRSVFAEAAALLRNWRCRALRTLRRWRAMSYYNAVRELGGPAFWAGKNPPGTIVQVIE